ncbi:uncharacterized protein LOC102801771 [Saccoglossus kowalevskii]
MSSREFTILYTHQKTKKAKTWHDGILKVILQGNKSVLYDDNKCKLDSLYVKPDQVVIGEQLESERYLILIEEERIESNNYKQDKLSDMIATQNKKNIYPGTTQYLGGGEIRPPHTLHPRLPTKRKRTGFTAPRQITKKPSLDEEPQNEIHLTATDPKCPSFSSPLFSTPYQMQHRQHFNTLYANGHDDDMHEGQLEMQNQGVSIKSETSQSYCGSEIKIDIPESNSTGECDDIDWKNNTDVIQRNWDRNTNKFSSGEVPVRCTSKQSDIPPSSVVSQANVLKRSTSQILALLSGKQVKQSDSQGSVLQNYHPEPDSSSVTKNLIQQPLFSSAIEVPYETKHMLDAGENNEQGAIELTGSTTCTAASRPSIKEAHSFEVSILSDNAKSVGDTLINNMYKQPSIQFCNNELSDNENEIGSLKRKESKKQNELYTQKELTNNKETINTHSNYIEIDWAFVHCDQNSPCFDLDLSSEDENCDKKNTSKLETFVENENSNNLQEPNEPSIENLEGIPNDIGSSNKFEHTKMKHYQNYAKAEQTQASYDNCSKENYQCKQKIRYGTINSTDVVLLEDDFNFAKSDLNSLECQSSLRQSELNQSNPWNLNTSLLSPLPHPSELNHSSRLKGTSGKSIVQKVSMSYLTFLTNIISGPSPSPLSKIILFVVAVFYPHHVQANKTMDES